MGCTENFRPNRVMDFNCSFGLIIIDLGQYFKISDQISSIYLVMDFNGSFGSIMVEFGGMENFRYSGLT